MKFRFSAEGLKNIQRFRIDTPNEYKVETTFKKQNR